MSNKRRGRVRVPGQGRLREKERRHRGWRDEPKIHEERPAEHGDGVWCRSRSMLTTTDAAKRTCEACAREKAKAGLT